MIELSDEILNKYLDGELEYAELIKVHELLKDSAEARKRLRALQAVHSGLKEMKEYSPSEGFTSLIMGRLYNRVKAKKGQKVFIF
jgi:anti-sigma factor RsiW